LALRFLAGAIFSAGIASQISASILCQSVSTAELNGVFYRTPTPEAVKSWRDQTGPDFVFAWKASKFITHWKRLSENSVNSLELLEDRLSFLGNKVGPILFQLPPNFKADADRLGRFFKMLPNKRRYSFEFRDSSWYAPRILKMLTEQNISLCLSDHHDAPAPWKRTADFVYIRGHGPSGRYKGRYPEKTLTEWARSIRSWKKRGDDVYVYFDNDQKSAAPADALKLRQMLI
jgi:uncharacterized protein YecE (DUF72 family)